MNATPFVLLAVGFLLIYIEFFLPGGIMGIAGSVLLVTSIVIFALQAESGLVVAIYIIGTFVLLGLLIWYALWRIRKGKTKGIFLSTIQEGYIASEFAEELVGREGEALSDLKPSGHILIDKKRYQAVSKTGYIIKGSKIEVVGGEGAHLIVKEIKEVEEV